MSAGYFDAIGMPVVRGRGFVTGEAAPSVVVNDTFVRRHFPAEAAVASLVPAWRASRVDPMVALRAQ